MRGVQTIDFDPDNASATSIMSEVNITGLGALSITPLAAAPGIGRQISMDNETATEVNDTITWTITGTDALRAFCTSSKPARPLTTRIPRAPRSRAIMAL